ncbi:MAG TPA: c-type cytochrome [Burkholderiales bacterium]|nr:c-type cytochrome [Burkholderiales bacterium]
MGGRPLLVLAAVWTAASGAVSNALAQQPDPHLARDLGRNLAAACASCHGTNGVSRAGMPALAGRDAAEIARLMQEFKAGLRPATVMQQIARGYSDGQVEAIAAYFSAQKAK